MRKLFCHVCGRTGSHIKFNFDADGAYGRYECKTDKYFDHTCVKCKGDLTGTDTELGNHVCGVCRVEEGQ